MSVTIRQAFPNSFGDAIPILTPLYGLKCDVWQFMDEGEVALGSDLDCHFVLPLEGVEKRHCTLTFRSGALSVKRNDGRVWINDIPVGRESALVVGDMLTIGPRSFEVGQRKQVPTAPVSLPVIAQPSPSAMPSTVNNFLTTTPSAASSGMQAASIVEACKSTGQDCAASVVSTEQSAAHVTSPSVSAQNSLAADLVELEEKRKACELREQQLLEHSDIIRERERSLSERQQMLDERNSLLAEQKASIEKQQSACAILEQTLRRQKDDMDSRLNAIVERELNLASQFEASAASYTQMEQSRLALAQQLEDVERRAAKVASQHTELTRLSGYLESDKSQFAAQVEDLSGRASALVAREADLEARLASLVAKEQTIEMVITDRTFEIDSRLNAIEVAEAATSERQLLLNQQEAEARTIRDELESFRSELQRQQVDLEEQSTRLTERAAALELQASEIAASRSAMESAAGSGTGETRSVGQLAAIAAERESAIRAKQEAFQALTDLASTRDALASEEARLAGWQAEIESRHTELAGRVAALKLLKKETASPVTSDSIATDQASSLQDEWQKLAARHAELDIKEAQIDELQANALAISRAAEAERDALQNSHKDLSCERNSLMQLSQDLQSRASGLHEREAKVQHQTEELRSRFDALHQQTAEFHKLEAELDARAAELNRRTADFATASSEIEQSARQSFSLIDDVNSGASPASSADNAQTTELANSLREMESERDAIAAQRDALMTAVRELQQAMQNAQADVEEARRVQTEFERQESRMKELYLTIEEKSSQLQLTDSRFRQTVEHLETLQAQIAQLTEEPDNAVSHLTLDQSVTDSSNTDDHETLLLNQIDMLRSELSTSRHEGPDRLAQSQQEIAERDQIIANLRDELAKVAGQDSHSITENNGIDAIDVDKLRSQLERADEVLRDRDDLIRELRARLMKQPEPAPAESIDHDSLQLEAVELDRRVTLLDRREQEIREQARRVAQSEDEVESQRRQLLDARQQLEIARAEIQVAMKQHGATNELSGQSALYDMPARSASGSIHESAGSAFGSNVSSDGEADSNASSTDLRAELANLFGLKKPASEPSAAPTTPIPDFFDLSEPAGESKAVSFHFDEHSSEIIQTPPPLPDASFDVTNEPAREENSDDFVRDYMEQLLNRSRKAAGNSLPDELKSPEAKRQPTSSGPSAASSKKSDTAKDRKSQDKKAPESKGPKTKSFIEQYMAGGFGDLTGDGSMPELVEQANDGNAEAEEVRPSEPRQPRAKIDRQKLRENMDSFRTLSTQSVENALVNHALRQERNNINGRIMFIVVLVGMSIFLAIANAKGIIQQPSLIWVTLVAAIGAAAELARKFYSVRVRSKSSLSPDEEITTPVAASTPMSQGESELVRNADVPATAFARTESHGVDGPGSGLQTSAANRGPIKIDDAEESSKYFEL